MTEASHQMTSNPLPHDGPHKAGSVGRAQGGVSVAILDAQNRWEREGMGRAGGEGGGGRGSAHTTGGGVELGVELGEGRGQMCPPPITQRPLRARHVACSPLPTSAPPHTPT